jgi:hypothetical protein
VICYRDRAYCSASTSGKCVNRECDRYATAEIVIESVQSFPLALADFSKRCGKQIHPKPAEPLGR